MQVLLAQLAPAPGDPEANLATIVRTLDEHPEADLAVFPELFVSGYDPGAAASLALAAGDPAFGSITAAARTHHTGIVVGFAERIGGQSVANAAACIGPDGAWVATYRKVHLFGGQERACFDAGHELVVAELGDVRVGPLICFDVEFPEPARGLCQCGASVLVTVAANMEPFGPDHELAARARALDNRRPHIYVNRVGEQSGNRFVGGSLVVDASGEIVARLGSDADVRCVELDPQPEVPFDLDYLTQVRNDLPVRSHALAHPQGGSRR